ncbi:MAG: coproporphyrinogen dehydrogenase HemZ [Lachnospiraceae bacterium]|nr:coproporphyrinogen dehydrogenase HemZ [Lachnospiraceae bacterium]
MILLSYNSESFEYDAYALLTSFYPEAETKQCLSDAPTAAADELHIHASGDGEVLLLFKKGELFTRDVRYEFRAEQPGSHEWKWAFKLFLYDSLADYSGRSLPWGGLTGVRPTKLILGTAREQGLKEDALVSFMREHYRVSEAKARLGYRIAMLEDSLLTPFRDGGYSLYIGIPFCPSTCLYCSFLSYPIAAHQKKVDEYLGCVEKELAALPEIMGGEAPDTVYIGGGTPTALSAEELERLLEMLRTYVPLKGEGALAFRPGIGGLREFTVEAGRPDSITADKLRVMKKYGVDRISVNPQTFKDETLKLIGRHHTTEQLREAFGLARSEGFDNINMDLILGLPGESPADVEHTLACAEELSPDSLTVHSLAIKRASRMKEWIAQHGAISGMDYEHAMGMAQEAAARMNMQPYYLYRQKNMAGALENTGFAREGKYGLYNIIIMEEVQSIYAIGAGTVSKRVYTDGSGRIERCDTHKDLKLYLEGISEMIERKRKLFGRE